MSILAPRLATSLAIVLAALGTPVLAADWAEDTDDSGGFRGSYSDEPKDWSGLGDPSDGVHLETGIRYWYSMGKQNFQSFGADFENNDKASLVELHLRIDDDASRTYITSKIGYSAAINGTYTDADHTDATISDGKIGYVGADFGWNAFGDGQGSGVGVFAGYQYWNDSPRTSRSNFTTAKSAEDVSYDPSTGEVFLPFDSADNNLDLHMLRMGVSGRAELGGMFDITAEAAAIPYASIHGILGGSGFDPSTTTPLGNYSFVKSSETTIDGWGYGAAGEVMLGITPVENLTFRIGGRAWYVQGTADQRYSAITLTDPSDSDVTAAPNYDTPPTVSNQGYIDTATPFSLFRYGLLAEMTYKF
ncbi:hypothetical protein [Devosia sp.]|uniref:hypothetical protein n=1 Tax=Devosia sp. TaxID=1871048 RepID=UPI003BA9DEDF